MGSPMWLSREATLLVSVSLCVYVVHGLWQFSKRFRTPLRRLPGPPRDSLIWGNFFQAMADHRVVDKWKEEYGPTFVMPSPFGYSRLSTIDPRAVNHILSHTDLYQKPENLRVMLRGSTGEGLLLAEGDIHKRQRRIMNPSFSPGQIREVIPIFFDTANQLREVLNSILNKGKSEIDMYEWVGRAALDIIGQAGFDYQFNALYDKNNELFKAFHDMFAMMSNAPIFNQLRNRIPVIRYIPTKRDQILRTALKTTRRIGMQLVQGKKAAIQQEMHGTSVEKGKIVGRDLLSSLIRANMAADLTPAHRMSDEEVLAQISTFIVAGHETTAAGLTWTLMCLAQHPEAQNKLRAELSVVSEEAPSMDDLNALPYLDMVIKETMRLHAPVHASMRTALQDDDIPLAHPVVDKYGVSHDSIRVQAGDYVALEILVMNHSKELWGPDALEFRPERWSEDIGAANEVPGIYSHMLTFIGGPRACIGYRFSIIETKALLFTLIRSFEFAPVPGKKIWYKHVAVARPVVRGEEKRGLQLPMIVRRGSRG